MDIIDICNGEGSVVPIETCFSVKKYNYSEWIDSNINKLLYIKNLYKNKISETIKIVNRYYGNEVLNIKNCFISGSSLYTLYHFEKFTDIDLFVIFNPENFDLYAKGHSDKYGYIDYFYRNSDDKYYLIKLNNGVQVIFNKELNESFYSIKSRGLNGRNILNVLEGHFDFYHCCFCYYNDILYAINFCLYGVINKLLLCTEIGIDRMKVYRRINKFLNDYEFNLKLI